MTNFIISFGTINKKMLIPLIYIILYIFYNIYNFSIEYNEVSLFIDGIGFSVGELLIFFIAQFIKYRRNSKKKKKLFNKQYIKDYLILFLINIFYMIMRLMPFYFLTQDETDAGKYKELFINDSLEIIFMTLSTWFFLKYKYYIHHIISIIALVILSIIIDLVLKNFIDTNTSLVFSSIFYVLLDSVIYTYFKYLMEKKYYHFMDILFISGVFDCIIFLLSLTIILLVQNANNTNKLIFQFFYFFEKYGLGNIILIFFVGLIARGFILSFLEFKIINDLNPNFMEISYAISKIPSALIDIQGSNRWVVLVISIIQIFFILFYLEILEFNFCSLNKNTKKNIKDREHRLSISENNDNYDDDEIDLKGYDISGAIKIQEKMAELNEMNEMIEEKENED